MAARSDADLLEDLLALEQRLVSAYEAGLRDDAIDSRLGKMLLDHENHHQLEWTGCGNEAHPRSG